MGLESGSNSFRNFWMGLFTTSVGPTIPYMTDDDETNILYDDDLTNVLEQT